MEMIIAALIGGIAALIVIFVLPFVLFWTIWIIWKTIKWTFIVIGMVLSTLYYTIIYELSSKN